MCWELGERAGYTLSFGYEGESLTWVCRNFFLANGPYTCFEGTSSFPLLRGSRFLHFSLLFCISLPAYNSYRALSPLAVPAQQFAPFRTLFFHEPSPPSASGESSRPSHVRGNPANFDEFPRNELKETGAGGRERWTRFGRIVTYGAGEDEETATMALAPTAQV